MIIEILQIVTIIMAITVTVVHVCMFMRSLKRDRDIDKMKKDLEEHLISMQRAVDIARKQHITLVETKKD